MSTGGTGGHLFPALACADEMLQLAPDLKICLIGGGVKQVLTNQIGCKQDAFPYIPVSCAALSLKHPVKSLKGLYLIGRGTYEAYSALKGTQPDALIGFGSYFSLPPLLAAKWLKIPLFLHAADCIPGRVIRHFSRFAEMTFLHFAEGAQSLNGASCLVKMALRAHMRKGRYSRAEAAKELGVRDDLPTLLVFGGSQGARRLNQALFAVMERDKEDSLPRMQILHYTGDEQVVAPLKELYTKKGHFSLVKKYEERMDLAWTLADAAITRAGASTLAELIEYEVPTLLIPYPYAADNHQEQNALSLLAAGAGVEMVRESELTTGVLVAAIRKMLQGGSGSIREDMQTALEVYKRKLPSETMAQMILRRIYVGETEERRNSDSESDSDLR